MSKGGDYIMFYHMQVSFKGGNSISFEVKADNDMQAFRKALNNSHVAYTARDYSITGVEVLEMRQL